MIGVAHLIMYFYAKSYFPQLRLYSIFWCQLLDEYLQKTHAATHNQYKMKLLDVFEVQKQGEKERFVDCGNRSEKFYSGFILTKQNKFLSFC